MKQDMQRNFRFNQHYLDLLVRLSEELGLSQAEVIRRLLDQVDSRRSEILKIGQRLIGQIETKHGADAELVFRLAESGGYHDVFVDGAADDGLIGMHAKGDGDLWSLELGTRPQSDYEQGLFRARPLLYVAAVDPDSPATVSVRVADLHAGLVDLHGLVGR